MSDEPSLLAALGIRPFNRLTLWRSIAISLWSAGLLGVVLYVGTDLGEWRLLIDILVNSEQYGTSVGSFLANFFSNQYDDVTSAIFFHLYLAGWVGAALYKLAKLGPQPAGWVDFRKFTWLIICIVSVAGFPAMALVGMGLDAIEPGWWFDIARLILTPIFLPFAGLLTIAGLALLAGFLTFAFTFLLLHLPLMVFEIVNNRDIERSVNDQKKEGLALQIIRLEMWLRGEPLPDLPNDAKGARLATPREVASLHQSDAPSAMTFGHVGAPLALKTDKHVLIMASTRSGKGVTLIIPHLLRYQGSAFVLDPKGENAKATGRQRATLNEKVHVLDPFGITGLPQSRFNPLSRFTPINMEAESKALAAALFLVSDRERDHWTAAGQQLLATLILYVYASSDIPAEQKDLPTVRQILLGSLRTALNAMTEMDEAGGLLRDLAISFLDTPEREFGSVTSTARRQTEILDNPFMRASLSAAGPGDEVDFTAWHRGTMTVYLCLSAPKFPTFNRWLRLVLTSALDDMTDTLNPPPLPVCFMLDELATLGHLATVENAVGLSAGYGIQLISVFQDVAQMRDLYKGRWASFIGNAGVRALFNLDDFETAEYWSKFVGGRLTETRNSQEDIWGIAKGANVGEAMRPLLPPDKIMMDFASGKMLILAQGAHPIITDRVAYWDDRSLDGLWDDPRQPCAPAPAPEPPPPPPADAATEAWLTE